MKERPPFFRDFRRVVQTYTTSDSHIPDPRLSYCLRLTHITSLDCSIHSHREPFHSFFPSFSIHSLSLSRNFPSPVFFLYNQNQPPRAHECALFHADTHTHSKPEEKTASLSRFSLFRLIKSLFPACF